MSFYSAQPALPVLPPQLTPAQQAARETYLAASADLKYKHVDRVLDQRGTRTDEAFVGGQDVSSSRRASLDHLQCR